MGAGAALTAHARARLLARRRCNRLAGAGRSSRLSDARRARARAAEALVAFGTPEFAALAAGAGGCVAFGGLMSGLSLGLLSQDATDLEVVARTGSAEQRAAATRVAEVTKSQHWLLVTLLLCNAASMEGLPLLLDKIASPQVAIAVSVLLVLLVGEVLPQAVCSRYGLQVGAAASPLVSALMRLTAPVSWPIAKALDAALGEAHVTRYRRSELKALAGIERERGGLRDDETLILEGALELVGKCAGDVMTPLAEATLLSEGAVMDERTMTRLLREGHSRVPVVRATAVDPGGGGAPVLAEKPGRRALRADDLVGVLLVKQCIMLRPEDAAAVSALPMRELPVVRRGEGLFALIDLFQRGKSHLAAVVDEAAVMVGLVTLEDTLEELLGEEIADETDEDSADAAEFVNRQVQAARRARALRDR